MPGLSTDPVSNADCGHSLRSLVSSINGPTNATTNPETKSCLECELASAAEDVETQKALYEAGGDQDIGSMIKRRNDYKAARLRCNKAKAAIYNNEIRQEEENSALSLTEKSPTQTTAQTLTTRHVQFDKLYAHRNNSQYRDSLSYNRKSDKYVPGEHADRTGVGFEEQ